MNLLNKSDQFTKPMNEDTYYLDSHPDNNDAFYSDAVLYLEELEELMGKENAWVDLVRKHRLAARKEAAKDLPE